MQNRLPKTDDAWVKTVLADFDAFLLDHAACERKASAMAMTFVVRYPDRDAILDPMIRLAKEELSHFHQVFGICQERGLRFHRDSKDPYVNALLREVRQGRDIEFLDRLVMAGVVEARGHERFGLLAEALPPGDMKDFYTAITLSEARHCDLFVDLARVYFSAETVEDRLAFFLAKEAEIIAQIPFRPALH
jgi:tRNA-(ms[2]io[6]A)-hydroxylase